MMQQHIVPDGVDRSGEAFVMGFLAAKIGGLETLGKAVCFEWPF